MIFKFNFINFYYNAFQYIPKKKIFDIYLGRKINININSYFKKKYNSKEEFFFLSARSSLYFFLKNLHNLNKKKILVTSFTCDSVLVAIINAGYEPILIDIEKDKFSMDINDILNIDIDEYSIILIQHTFGIPAKYLEEIITFCKKNNKIIIEDCSLSFFSKIKNKNLGSFGDASIFSFELSKTITTQKGGCLIINNENLNLKFFKDRYTLVKYPNFFNDIRKKIQIFLSIYFYNSKFYNIWFFFLKILYNTNLFEKSTPKIENYLKIDKKNFLLKMSSFYKSLLNLQMLYEPKITKDIINNFNYLRKNITNKELCLNLDQLKNLNYIIRLPLIIKNKDLKNKLVSSVNFEVGYWFKNLASDPRFNKYQKYKKNNKLCKMSENLSKDIINIPLNISSNNKYYYNRFLKIINE
jgi:dTDP-4-amino-4,6-dideoxygalactose transaminase